MEAGYGGESPNRARKGLRLFGVVRRHSIAETAVRPVSTESATDATEFRIVHDAINGFEWATEESTKTIAGDYGVGNIGRAPSDLFGASESAREWSALRCTEYAMQRRHHYNAGRAHGRSY